MGGNFMAGDFLAHGVTFGDFMAGNFMAGDFLTRIRFIMLYQQITSHPVRFDNLLIGLL